MERWEGGICSNVIVGPLSIERSFPPRLIRFVRSFVRSFLLPRISRRNDVPLPYVTVDAPRDGWARVPPPQVCDNAKYMSPFLYLAAMHHPFLSHFPFLCSSIGVEISIRLSISVRLLPSRKKKFFPPLRSYPFLIF